VARSTQSLPEGETLTRAEVLGLFIAEGCSYLGSNLIFTGGKVCSQDWALRCLISFLKGVPVAKKPLVAKVQEVYATKRK
jgi:hypothetical protein